MQPHAPTTALHARRPHALALIAEDDAELRSLIEQRLRRAGYAVISTPSGKEAVEYLQASCGGERRSSIPPDIVISDVRMPGCSGLELLAQIRRIDWHTPVVIISAFAEPDMAEKVGAYGATLLPKPFDLAELERKVRRAAPPSATKPSGRQAEGRSPRKRARGR